MRSSASALAMLRRVAVRLRLVRIVERFYTLFVVLAVAYGIGLLVSRGFGLQGNWFSPVSILILPVVAILFSLIWHRRPTGVDAARQVDRHSGTKDLYLTLSMLDHSAGEYQPLVARDAEQFAQRVVPSQVVPLRFGRRLAYLALLAVLLLLGVLLVPQFDPFGHVAAAQQSIADKELLKKDRKATQLRVAELKEKDEASEESEEVKKTIEQLTQALKKMKRAEKKSNYEKLNQQQKSIGGQWREMSAERLKALLSQASSRQSFGGDNKSQLDKWTRQLQDGADEALRQELDELKNALKNAMQAKDPVKRQKMLREMKKKLRDLEKLASERIGSPQLEAAVKRALKQLDMADSKGLSAEAMTALQESLDLTKLELQEIAQSAKDLKSLEDALKVIQMAKQVNDQERLDGEAVADAESLSDYAEMYALLMEDQMGQGQGMGNRGFGEGGEAPEDDSVATEFQSERAKSAVTAGKVLMTIKSKGISDSGEARQEYRQLIDSVHQGYSEAIVQEQIPPGYHEGIRKYFDNIRDNAGEPAGDESR